MLRPLLHLFLGNQLPKCLKKGSKVRNEYLYLTVSSGLLGIKPINVTKYYFRERLGKIFFCSFFFFVSVNVSFSRVKSSFLLNFPLIGLKQNITNENQNLVLINK